MRHILLLLLMAAAPAVSAQEEWPLKQIFGKTNIGMVQYQSGAAVEHCPDDNCKRFTLDGKTSLATLHDFALLYLALVENYDIEQIKAPNGQRYFAMVLQRQKGGCSGADEAAVARCALAAMAARYPVKGFITKMEEGWSRREAWDIKAELRRVKITP